MDAHRSSKRHATKPSSWPPRANRELLSEATAVASARISRPLYRKRERTIVHSGSPRAPVCMCGGERARESEKERYKGKGGNGIAQPMASVWNPNFAWGVRTCNDLEGDGWKNHPVAGSARPPSPPPPPVPRLNRSDCTGTAIWVWVTPALMKGPAGNRTRLLPIKETERTHGRPWDPAACAQFPGRMTNERVSCRPYFVFFCLFFSFSREFRVCYP